MCVCFVINHNIFVFLFVFFNIIKILEISIFAWLVIKCAGYQSIGNNNNYKSSSRNFVYNNIEKKRVENKIFLFLFPTFLSQGRH